MRRFLIVYFSILVVLSLASYVPGLVFAAAIVTVGVGAFALIAANTILLYSAALLPAHIVLRSPLRVPSKIAGFALLLLIPATIARAPGWLSRQLAEQFAREMSLGDYEQPALGRPKSIEIAAGETAARAPPCEDICQRLLFNREVERVRLVRLPFPTAPRGAASSAVAYSIAQQSPCPQVFPRGAQLDKTVRDRIVGGECLIATVDDQSQPDLKLTRTTLYAFDFERPDPRYLPQPEIIPPWPFRSKETRIERLVIEQRGEDAAYHPIMQRTETKLAPLATPFYFGYDVQFSGGIPGPNFGPALGRDSIITINPTDMAQLLRSKFGFRLDDIKPLSPARTTAFPEQILTSPTQETFSAEQQSVIADAITDVAQKSELADSDVAFIRRVIADARIDNPRIGISVEKLFRKFPSQMQPAVAQVIERLSVPVPQERGHYNSLLGWALMVYPADVLKPFREDILQIVERQPDWPTGGLLARVAELGGDPTDLIKRRLDSKTNDVRIAAATAACRATPETWTLIEPMVLNHLAQTAARGRWGDEDHKLLLALTRFGNKAAVDNYVSRFKDDDKTRIQQRLSRYEPGFAVARCQGRV